MTENNEDARELTFGEKLYFFFKTKEAKEIVGLHFGIFIVAALIYLPFGLVPTVGFLVVALFAEMFVLHVVWIYRDNKDRDNPLRYAIFKEFVNIVVAVVAIGVFILFNNLIYTFTGVAIFVPVALLFGFGFIAFSFYAVYKSEITMKDVRNFR